MHHDRGDSRQRKRTEAGVKKKKERARDSQYNILILSEWADNVPVKICPRTEIL